jgi:multidrug resistance efflux pump
MSRGFSSRRKNLLPKAGLESDATPSKTAAVVYQTDIERPPAVQPAPASIIDEMNLKFPAQTVHKLDAAGRLALLEWALSEAPLSKSEGHVEKKPGRKRRRTELSHPAASVLSATASASQPGANSALVRRAATMPARQHPRSVVTKVPPEAALPPRLSPATQQSGRTKAGAWRPTPVLDLSAEIGSPLDDYVRARSASPHSENPYPAGFDPDRPDPARPNPETRTPPEAPQDLRADRKGGPVQRLLTSPFPSRLIKTVAGIAIMITVGLAPLQRLFQSSSVEAIVNAHTITLRAPIDGQIRAETTAGIIGKTLGAGETIFTIENRRADRSRLDDLQRSWATLEEERPLLANRLESRRALYRDLSEQTRLFLAGRIAQLEARAAEIRAEIASTEAQRDEANAAFARMTELVKSRTESIAALMRSERDSIVAKEAAEAAQHRLEGVQVELEAARQGTFIGDSYNDRPHSAQRAEELVQEIAELETSLRAHDIRIERLRGEVGDETFRQSLVSNALVSAPGKGRIWEVLTSDGEEVHKGQDLVRLLDCSSSVVTAVVSETVYNRLRIGSPARFRFRDDGKEWSGEVIGLTGVAASPANLAIQPSALIKESYHVAVNVPALANLGTCDVGRTGRVIFEEPAAVSPPVAAPSR